MEWKLLDVFDIKPIYEISSNGDIRKLESKKFLTGHEGVTLTLRDGTHKYFFRKRLVDAVFNKRTWTLLKIDNVKPIYEISEDGKIRNIETKRIYDAQRIRLQCVDGSYKTLYPSTIVKLANPNTVWKPLTGFNLKPIYEISPDGDIRNTETCTTLRGVSGRTTLTTLDGSKCGFIKAVLTNAVYSNIYDSDNVKFDDDVLDLIREVHIKLNDLIRLTVIDIVKSKHDNMFIIRSDRFKYPISVRKETNGLNIMYIIRTGVHWLDTEFYGSEITSCVRIYAECTPNDIMTNIISFALRSAGLTEDKILSKSDKAFTPKKCETFCQLFVKNGFKFKMTYEMCRRLGIYLSLDTARKIVKKQLYRDISDRYFEYLGKHTNLCMSDFKEVHETKGE